MRTAGGTAPRPLRVLALPAFRNGSGNPYNALLYGEVLRHGIPVDEVVLGNVVRRRYRIFHIHWPDDPFSDPRMAAAYAKAATVMSLVASLRARGTRIVWTVHNLEPHRTVSGRSHQDRFPGVQAAFLRAFTRLVDGYIALSEDGRQRAVDRYPRLARTPGWVIPHGHFRASYPRGASREEARRRLGLPDEGPVLLNFGQISAYKNIPRLLAAFRSLDLPAATLLVAGSPTVPAVAEEVRAGAAHDPRVRLHLRYIPEDEVQLYFAAADVVVLPYTNILNSGNALLALSFDRPVLVPDRGSMGELRRDVGDAWVRTYAGEVAADVLRDAILWAVDTPRPAPAPLDRFDWRAIGQQTADVFRSLAR